MAALAIHDHAERWGRSPGDVSLILLELGGAFTAGLAVRQGRIVDGMGGTSGPIGWRSAGRWDGEVAFLAGEVSKGALFQGGVESVLDSHPGERALAVEAYVEGAAKMVSQLRVAAPDADEIVLSGRMASDEAIGTHLRELLGSEIPLRALGGFAARARQGAQGAAILADGLAGGGHRELVERMRLRNAAGTVLDHLYVVPRAQARLRLGLAAGG